jgi:hypothetical protein
MVLKNCAVVICIVELKGFVCVCARATALEPLYLDPNMVSWSILGGAVVVGWFFVKSRGRVD